MSTNNEVFIYDTAVVNLGHFSLSLLKLEYVIQKLTIFFDANFINVFFELIVNYERVQFFFCSKLIF
jgi:hypothetical protein